MNYAIICSPGKAKSLSLKTKSTEQRVCVAEIFLTGTTKNNKV